MRKSLFKIFLIFILLFSSVFSEERFIAVFNTLRLGRGEKDYLKMSKAIEKFDIVGLVEVMDKKGVEELADTLYGITGEKWEYHISPYPVGHSSYKEYYGYIYKKNSVEFLGQKGYYPDVDKKFTRPPYGAEFKIDNFVFTLVLAHSIFGKQESQRRAEAFNYHRVYDYFKSLDDDGKIILGGDFNLPAVDEGFEKLLNHKDNIVYAVDYRIKTTIGAKGFANSYDNIFISKKLIPEFKGKSGAYDFTGGDYKYSREKVSDHIPVFIVVETGE
ncbi:MAG: endonuclease/exonuclease/phosphatase family protein [Fusobacteriaceae bacterium]